MGFVFYAGLVERVFASCSNVLENTLLRLRGGFIIVCAFAFGLDEASSRQGFCLAFGNLVVT